MNSPQPPESQFLLYNQGISFSVITSPKSNHDITLLKSKIFLSSRKSRWFYWSTYGCIAAAGTAASELLLTSNWLELPVYSGLSFAGATIGVSLFHVRILLLSKIQQKIVK